ncbi:protein YIPF2 isoform X1 [Sylvia atricapilla]|uniref:protein YIPF2 isoform X1 n=1 Tax=Sylvia atricapilla TaxID=48155 RepID=UPI0033923146
MDKPHDSPEAPEPLSGASVTVSVSESPEYGDDADTAELLPGRPRQPRGFWTFEFYRAFFDVDTRQVLERIKASVLPVPGKNFVRYRLRNNPDLPGLDLCHTLSGPGCVWRPSPVRFRPVRLRFGLPVPAPSPPRARGRDFGVQLLGAAALGGLGGLRELLQPPPDPQCLRIQPGPPGACSCSVGSACPVAPLGCPGCPPCPCPRCHLLAPPEALGGSSGGAAHAAGPGLPALFLRAPLVLPGIGGGPFGGPALHHLPPLTLRGLQDWGPPTPNLAGLHGPK